MSFGDVNYLAVLVAAVAYFLLGALWYSPVLFARPWMRATGVEFAEGADRPSPLPQLLAAFVAYFVTALAMAFLAGATGADDLASGALLGLVTGAGFAATVLLVTHAFEQRPPVLFAINAAQTLIGFVLVGIIVSVWQ